MIIVIIIMTIID